MDGSGLGSTHSLLRIRVLGTRGLLLSGLN